MKFTKFGKALLVSALSAGVVIGAASCLQSYTVGYLYVTGTVTSGSNGNGIISGFKIDHNTGFLTPVNGLPISSGGANPVRAILVDASRFLYVLNRGVNANGNSDCHGTAAPTVCTGANITQFIVGANGILTPQETFTTQGFNPFRMIADSSGSYIYVLERDSPDNANPSSKDGCALALTSVQTCGDITAFKIDQTTGRLSLVVNDQVTAALGGSTGPLTYFPVPVNAIDFVLYGSNVLVLSGTPATGDTVFPYGYSSQNGQLSVSQNGVQPLTNSQNANGMVNNATAIVSGGSYVFVLDNEPIEVNGAVASQSQILPYSLISGGALQAAVTGPIPDDANQSNPIYLLVENKGKWFYVANQGNLSTPTIPLSGLSGYVINSPFDPSEIAGTPINFGSGGGPQCLVEDPSNQFFYTANFNDSTVTGQMLNQQAGNLTPLSQTSKAPSQYTLQGPPTWCLVDGRIGG
ncbi:MAG: hypothetical protein ABR991_04175 [Terracidiphilus sp.]